MERIAQGDDYNGRIHIGDPTSDEGREANYIDINIKATDSVDGTPGEAVITLSNATGVVATASTVTISLA